MNDQLPRTITNNLIPIPMKNSVSKFYRICDDIDYPHPGHTVYCFSDAMEFSRYIQDQLQHSPSDSLIKFFEITGNLVRYDESNIEDESDAVVHVISARKMTAEEVKKLNPQRVRGTSLRGQD
jgi:hypothetical protein